MELPQEILIEIFKRLDRDSLRACLGVSPRFRSLVLGTSALMQELPLNLTESHALSKLEFIKNHGNSVKKVIVRDHAFYLAILLNKMPKLSKIVLVDKSYQYQVNPQLMKALHAMEGDEFVEGFNASPTESRFANLQELTLVLTNQFTTQDVIAKFLPEKSLSVLKIFTKSLTEQHFVLVRKFLSQQICLKSLTLSTISLSDSFFENFDRMPFRLESLTIGWQYDKEAANASENFSKFFEFLQSQAGTLRLLQLGDCGAYDERVSESSSKLAEWMMGAYFKRNLMVNLAKVYDGEEFLFARSVEELKSGGRRRRGDGWKILNDAEDTGKLEKYFANLKRLRFWYFDVFKFQMPNAAHLRHLDVFYHRSFMNFDKFKSYFGGFSSISRLIVRFFDDNDENLGIFLRENCVQLFGILSCLRQLKVCTYGYAVLVVERAPCGGISTRVVTLRNESAAARILEIKSVLADLNAEILDESKYCQVLEI